MKYFFALFKLCFFKWITEIISLVNKLLYEALFIVDSCCFFRLITIISILWMNLWALRIKNIIFFLSFVTVTFYFWLTHVGKKLKKNGRCEIRHLKVIVGNLSDVMPYIQCRFKETILNKWPEYILVSCFTCINAICFSHCTGVFYFLSGEKESLCRP